MTKYFSLKNIIIAFTALLFFLPLVFWKISLNPFIFYKAIWLQVFTAALLVVYFIAVLYHWKTSYPRFSWLGLSVLIFYTAIILSAFFGVDFWRSFWSRPERMIGVFVMLHYGVLFLVWRSMLSKEAWFRLWQWFVGINSAVLIVAVLQIFFPNLLFNIGSVRVSTTLGNPIFVAGFSLFAFFSSSIFWQRAENKYKRCWLAVMALSIITLFASQTRGAAIGLWAGLVFLVIGLLADADRRNKYKKSLWGALVLVLLVPALLPALSSFSWAQKIPLLGRFAVTSLEQSTGGTRLIFWQEALNGWKERPALGWGWENYYDLNNKHYLPQILKYGRGEEWADNAHNIIFNTLATTGLVGLAGYLLIYFSLYYYLFRKFRQKDEAEKFLSVGLGALLLAHLVQNLFIFENLTSYLFFFWLLAGVDINFALSNTAERKVIVGDAKKNIFFKFLENKYLIFFWGIIRVIIVIFIMAATALLLYRFAYIPAKADWLAAKGVVAATTDFKSALAYHRTAVRMELNPYRSDIAFQFSEFILSWMNQHPDFPMGQYRALAQEMYVIGVQAMQSYLTDHPGDVRAGSVLAQAYLDGYDFWLNPGYAEMAAKEYDAMLAYSPKRQSLMFGLMRAKLAFNSTAEAVELAKKAVDEDPGIGESHFMLAFAYDRANNQKLAYEEAKKAVELGYYFSQKDLVRCFDLFKKNGTVGLIEPQIHQYLYGKGVVNGILAQLYVDYLNSVGRFGEAEGLRIKYLAN